MSRKQAQILDKLVAGKALSPEGRSFVISSLDPFHDSEIRIDGFPDITSSRSVVQVVQVVKTLTKPAGLPAGNWDLHLFNMPVSYNTNLSDGVILATNLQRTGRILQDLNGPECGTGLAAFATAPGADWYNNSSNSKNISKGLQLESRFSTGRHRLFGMGYEAVNTTAEIYQQGSVTTYKRPARAVDAVFSEGTPATAYKHYKFISTGVANSAEAAVYPNSKTWAAKEGVYAICTLNDVDCPVTEAIPGSGVFATTSNKFDSSNNQWGVGTLPSDETLICTYPFDITGAVFTGLSEQSALTVTVRYLIERFPEKDSPDLIVLGRPSPSYDPLALELYARCLEHLPSAVMVKENPFGEWFGKILQTIGKYAPAVGSVLPGVGSIVGNAVGALASTAGNALVGKSHPQQQQQLPAPAPVRPPAQVVARPTVLRASPSAPANKYSNAVRRLRRRTVKK